MKSLKAILVLLCLGVMGFADAQYYYGPPGPPPPPPPRYHRDRDQGNDEPELTVPSGYFEVGIGLSQPLGSFAGEVGTNYKGYALPGDNFSLSLGIPVNHSNFGVALMYSNCFNQFDMNGYLSNIQMTDPNNLSYYADRQDAYDESFIMGGLFATYPVQRLSFDFRLMGGVAICSLPDVLYNALATSPSATNDFQWETNGSTSSSFAFDIGGGIRYKFRRISFMAGIDFMQADPMVSTTQEYTDQYGNTSYSHVSGTVPISILSYSLGLGYSFR